MKKEDFEQEIYMRIRKQLDDTYRVDLKKVIKNNGTKLTGIIISERNTEAAPTIYLDSFFRSELHDEELNDIVLEIINCYRSNRVNQVDMSFYTEFEKVKDHICYKLISREKNEELLSEVPYIPFHDLAICFFYYFEKGVLPGPGSILIRLEHMKRWNVTAKELYQLASVNTPRLFPVQVMNINQIISDILKKQGKEETEIDSPIRMYVVTNTEQRYGAISLFYPGEMEKMYSMLGDDFYILPSSVHELILIPKEECDNPAFLQDMVQTVNRTEILEEEFLSDMVYEYKKQLGVVDIVFCSLQVD